MKSLRFVFTSIFIIIILFSGGCATKKRTFKDAPGGSGSTGNTSQAVKAPASVSGAEEFVYEFDVMVDVDPQKMAEPRPDFPEPVSPSETRSADTYGQQSQQSQQSQLSPSAGSGTSGSNTGSTGSATGLGSAGSGAAGALGLAGTAAGLGSVGSGAAGSVGAGGLGSEGAAAGSNTAGNGTAGSSGTAGNFGSAGALAGSAGSAGIAGTGAGNAGTAASLGSAGSSGSAGTTTGLGSAGTTAGIAAGGVGGSGSERDAAKDAAGSTNDYAAEFSAGFTAGFAAGSQGSANTAGTTGANSRSAAYAEGYTAGFAAVRRTADSSGSAGTTAGLGSAGTTAGSGIAGGLGSDGAVVSYGFAGNTAGSSSLAGTAAGNRAVGSPGGPGGERRRNNNIVGSGSVNVEGVMDYIKIRNRNPVLNEENTRRIINSYVDEAVKEDVNYDFAIAQMLYWTAFLTHKQRVESNNFAGLQTTNAWRGTFKTPEDGVKAHIQHLRGYSHGTLKDPSADNIDPRWEHISHFRGTIKNFEQIYPRWSENTARYRRNIVLILNDMYRYSERYSKLYR